MIVAGFGYSTRATCDSLNDALQRACTRARVSAPEALATIEDKMASLATLADLLDIPVFGVSQEMLAAQTTRTHSARVARERGTGSVAEAAALAAAGPGARLLTGRIHAKDRYASCALAEGNPK